MRAVGQQIALEDWNCAPAAQHRTWGDEEPCHHPRDSLCRQDSHPGAFDSAWAGDTCRPSVWGSKSLLLTLPMLVFKGAAEVRLADGSSRCAGRVEVKKQDQWRTVCDGYWDVSDAAVVCRQLGCGGALKVHWNAHFGPGSGPIWMDYVDCRGTESALSDCNHAVWRPTDCTHRRDAGVTCSGKV